MKLALLFVLLWGVIFSQEPIFITEYHNAFGKKKELKFIKKYKSSTDINIKPYLISLEMKQAEYATFPWKKLSIFNEGKKRLAAYIKNYPKNIHSRYIRFLLQEKSPKILGYNKQIKHDKEILQKYLNIKESTDYLDKYIKKHTSL